MHSVCCDINKCSVCVIFKMCYHAFRIILHKTSLICVLSVTSIQYIMFNAQVEQNYTRVLFNSTIIYLVQCCLITQV